MARIQSSDTSRAVLEILVPETGEHSPFKPVTQMTHDNHDGPDDILVLLEKLKQDFIEGLGR